MNQYPLYEAFISRIITFYLVNKLLSLSLSLMPHLKFYILENTNFKRLKLFDQYFFTDYVFRCVKHLKCVS